MNLCTVRPSKADDLPYVSEVWLRELLPYTHGPIREIKYALRELLGESDVLVAAVPDDDDAILGFAVIHREGLSLFSYTRHSARGLGVQRRIFEYRKQTSERQQP